MDKPQPSKAKKSVRSYRVEGRDARRSVVRDASTGSTIYSAGGAKSGNLRKASKDVRIRKAAALELAAKRGPRMVAAVQSMDFRPPDEKERAIAESLVPQSGARPSKAWKAAGVASSARQNLKSSF